MISAAFDVDAPATVAIERTAATGAAIAAHEIGDVDHHAFAIQPPVQPAGDGQQMIADGLACQAADGHPVEPLIGRIDRLFGRVGPAAHAVGARGHQLAQHFLVDQAWVSVKRVAR